MIDNKMAIVLKATQSYCLKHFQEEMKDEAFEAFLNAAQDLAHWKKYYDVMKDDAVYLPSCKKLILSRELIDQAKKCFDGGV